jgi:hypothetical protein
MSPTEAEEIDKNSLAGKMLAEAANDDGNDDDDDDSSLA